MHKNALAVGTLAPTCCGNFQCSPHLLVRFWEGNRKGQKVKKEKKQFDFQTMAMLTNQWHFQVSSSDKLLSLNAQFYLK